MNLNWPLWRKGNLFLKMDQNQQFLLQQSDSQDSDSKNILIDLSIELSSKSKNSSNEGLMRVSNR